jgi:MGT family glycosyltransferase
MEAIPRSETDGGRPLVYVCFGTSFNRRPAQFRAVIDALAGEPFDVIVSLGGAKFPPAELGAPPANVVVESFAPGREVLARAHAHVTHGGCNSVHESLLAGVPMVCVPQAYDQFPLVERIEALGAARVAPEEPEAIRDAVRLLLADESAGRCAEELGRHLGEYDGESRVARLFEELLADAAGGGRHAVV